MKKIVAIASTLLLGVSAWGQSNLYIDYSTKGADVPKSMYGIFFEEISHSGDGGLYAELIQNRGFEEHVTPSGMTYKDGRVYAPAKPDYLSGNIKNYNIPWDIETSKFLGWTLNNVKCSAQMDVTSEKPLHENTPHSMRIDISNMQKGGSSVFENSGYWGIAVKEGEKYKLRFYLRSSANKGNLIAKIVDGSTVYAQQKFTIKNSGNWEEYTTELTANATNGACRFQLEFNTNGTVWVDYVSLFPQKTFKERENGMRADLAQFLSDMKPAFMRWPGGCVVEGMTIENRIKWKETLGDPMQRQGEYNRWGYRSTMGFGYHEFLQYCEDIGADAMFVANVGLACTFNNGDYVDKSEFPKYMQDIRDAIEYAIGDVSTTWGAKRMAAGHPEPFPLKYVELGNEQWGAYYAKEVYNAFYNVLKPDYPHITFISTLEVTRDVELMEKKEMIDPHYYKTMDWFYNNTFLYDAMKRREYKLYVGEYTCNQNVGSGHMGAALSEAAFMSGMERNADLVTMTSYAPLIENNNKRAWATNMIWVNAGEVMGRSSYYVQKMYANNRPDYNIATQLINSSSKPAFQGRIGLATWNTQADFKDLKVSKADGSRVFYSADFSDKTSDWQVVNGTWSQKNGVYSQTAINENVVSLLNAYSFNDCVIELKARKRSGAEGFVVVFGAPENDLNTRYQFNIGGWNNTQTAIQRTDDEGKGDMVSEPSSFTVENDRWYDIKIVLTEGNKIDCFIDGKLIVSSKINPTAKLQAISGYDEASGETVIKIVNGEGVAQKVNFTLNSSRVESKGKVITLSANSLTDENSFDKPTLISPIETEYAGFAPKFDYIVKPYSFTILRVKSDKKSSGNLRIPSWYSDEPVAL